jgi:hypothetical protein
MTARRLARMGIPHRARSAPGLVRLRRGVPGKLGENSKDVDVDLDMNMNRVGDGAGDSPACGWAGRYQWVGELL